MIIPMKKKKGQAGRDLADELQQRILQRNRAIPLADIAKGAQISPKTLIDIKDGKLRSAVSEATAAGNRRRLVGLAATVTRLTNYLDLDPEAALREAGFDLNDRLIQEAFIRTTAIVRRPHLVSDPTLLAIKARSDQGGGVVKVAQLNWEPFYRDKNAECFAKRYIRMVIGSIDPTWVVDDEPAVDSIPAAINGLVKDPNEFDMIVGLYDTPARRSLGLSFVPIPGFRVPVGAVTKKTSNIGWKSIIDPRNSGQVHGVALEEEIGYYVIAGASGYPEASRTLLARHDQDEIAVEFIGVLEKYKTSNTDVFFIADRFTCDGLIDLVHSYRSGRKDLPVSLESVDLPDLKLVEKEEEEWAPAYPVAIALRADSDKLEKFMRQAVCVDVFRNAALRAARFYYDLLNDPSSSALRIEKEEFEFLGKQNMLTFFKAFIAVVDDDSQSREWVHKNLNDRHSPIAKLYTIAQEAKKEGE